MAKPVKSQWDFGELFPREATRTVLTVSEVTSKVKGLLERQIGQVWVTGEVTNFRAQSSGHFYFTIKDVESQLSCVLFRNDARDSRNFIQDGRKVILQGELTVYVPRGQYQMRVTAVELQGVGALQAAFEKLKQKLNTEGLFAQERKRALPRFPQCIGIVTSPTGAAIRDVLHVIQRRNPALEIILAPCRVQGQGAAEEIAASIRLLNEWNSKMSPASGQPLDLILITRGGGSLEDLWAFNEEVVARAIFESQLPVVSAVGHEIDFTISDFVADFRAATPSAAAEIITQDVVASCQFLSAVNARMRELFRQRLEDKEYEMVHLLQRLQRTHPSRRVNEFLQHLDDLRSSLLRCAKHGVRNQQTDWRNLFERLQRVRPRQLLKQRRELLNQAQNRLHEQAGHHLQNCQSRLATLNARLRLLGPEQVLARGYSITLDAETGALIYSDKQVRAGQKLKTRLKTGEVRSTVDDG